MRILNFKTIFTLTVFTINIFVQHKSFIYLFTYVKHLQSTDHRLQHNVYRVKQRHIARQHWRTTSNVHRKMIPAHRRTLKQKAQRIWSTTSARARLGANVSAIGPRLRRGLGSRAPAVPAVRSIRGFTFSTRRSGKFPRVGKTGR